MRSAGKTGKRVFSALLPPNDFYFIREINCCAAVILAFIGQTESSPPEPSLKFPKENPSGNFRAPGSRLFEHIAFASIIVLVLVTRLVRH